MRKIEYYSFLKADYVNTGIVINYDEINDYIASATLHSNSLGVITFDNGLIEVHLWENEDHVRDISELSKRFTSIMLNGITNDNEVKENIIKEIQSFIINANVNLNDLPTINKLIHLLQS
jgi:hypothetical protein